MSWTLIESLPFTQMCNFVYVCGNQLHHKGVITGLPYNLNTLEIGQTVGCKVTSNGDFHIFVNGEDKNLVTSGVPIDKPFWGVFDVYGKVAKIKYCTV